jgi:hypothetical protein
MDKICNYCGHRKANHSGGLGMCSSYEFSHFCHCSRYMRPKRRLCACGADIPPPNETVRECKPCQQTRLLKEIESL